MDTWTTHTSDLALKVNVHHRSHFHETRITGHFINALNYTCQDQKVSATSERKRNCWRRGHIEIKGHNKCWIVPSKAGRNDDSDRHGILDFFLVTIGSLSDFVCNMGLSLDGRTSARDTPHCQQSGSQGKARHVTRVNVPWRCLKRYPQYSLYSLAALLLAPRSNLLANAFCDYWLRYITERWFFISKHSHTILHKQRSSCISFLIFLQDLCL